jgi:hypothetical protein
MGLDMYAYSVEAGKLGEGETSEVFYWRKFNALHGWMEDLYRQRGGEEVFNCQPLRLYEVDLMRLLKDSKTGGLEPREGFFFGEPTIYPEDLATIKRFVDAAMAEIKDGREVYYDSWW